MLNNIAKSHFKKIYISFNGIPKCKAKDPQSFNEWLQQIGRVTSLMNKDPYKYTLAKSQGSSAELSVHIHPLWNGTKLKNNYTTILAL